NTDGRPQGWIVLTLGELPGVRRGGVIRQSLCHASRERGLHFNVQIPLILVCSKDIQYRKFVLREFLIQNGIQELHLCNPRLANEDGVEKVNCDSRMLRASQHQLEGEVNEWANPIAMSNRLLVADGS
ncbi:MAG: hypothetical protein RL215_2607, partial [Planctomycetota bacterium]